MHGLQGRAQFWRRIGPWPSEIKKLKPASGGCAGLACLVLLYTGFSPLAPRIFAMNTTTDSVMTVKEVADYLRVNQRTVYRLAVDRKLPGFKVGTTWRFKRADIDRWIDAQAASSLPEPGVGIS